MLSLVFPYTMVVDFKCRQKTTDNLSISLHILSANILWKLLRSRETEEFIDFICNYENQRLEGETPKDKGIYMEFVKESNNLVGGSLFLAVVAATLWFYVGVK